MNPPHLAEVLLQTATAAQTTLPLATDGALRYVWEGRYGSMLIEVIGDEIYVNGARVKHHCK